MAALETTNETETETETETEVDLALHEGEHWKDHAVCAGRIELFFPRRAERPQARARRERHARRLCAACPVQVQCQEAARANREYGFWGGESEEERHLAGYTVTAPIGIRIAGRTLV